MMPSARRARCDDGFTIVESMIALAMLFVAMVGMLATLTGGLRGVVTGRQREHALTLATATLEAARAEAFDRIGHDLAGDTTLTGDPDIAAVDGHWQFEGEDLVGVAGATEPLTPHEVVSAEDGSTYTRRVYVTWADPATSPAGVKRITAVVSWDQAQFGSAGTLPVVRTSSLLSASGDAVATERHGQVDVEGPSLAVTGTAQSINLESARWWGTIAVGELDDAFAATVSGYGTTSRARIDADGASGCVTADDDSWAECGALRADSSADDDASTPADETTDTGTLVGVAGNARAAPTLRFTINAGATTKSSSTARSTNVGDDDGRPFHRSEVHGLGSPRLMLSLDGDTFGRLLSVGSAGETTASLDVDPAGDHEWLTAAGRLVIPSVDLVTLGTPDSEFSNYSGALRLTTATLTGTAAAGVGAPSPALSGGPVTVQLYSTNGSNGYVCYHVSPLDASVKTCADTATTLAPQHAEVTGSGFTYVVDSQLRVAPAVLTSSGSGATKDSASTRLSGWLVADIHVDVYGGSGLEASFDLHFDAGTIVAESAYEAHS